MNEAKRAAVVKRGAERDHRDLFASRPADLGSVKQTLRPPPPDSLLGGVAARNESSVLFTVDALRSAGAARVKTPEPELAPALDRVHRVRRRGHHRSQVALVGSAEGRRALGRPALQRAAAGRVRGGRRLVGLGRPVAAPNGFKFGKRAIAGLAAAAVAVVLCSIGLAAAFKGEEPVAHAANAVHGADRASRSRGPCRRRPGGARDRLGRRRRARRATTTRRPRLPPRARARAARARPARPAARQSSGVASSKSKSSSSETLVSKPAPKAADKCGCKGDFTCILRCTAKGS